MFLIKSIKSIDAGKILEKILYKVSVYLVPLVTGLISIIAFVYWPSQYNIHGGKAIEFQAIQELTSAWQPTTALFELDKLQAVTYRDTELIETPFWVQFSIQPDADLNPDAVEFPSRHSNTLTCWESDTLVRIGGGNRIALDGSVIAMKAGFALALKPIATPLKVLCRIESVGPGRISLFLWDFADLKQSELEFQRRAGLLDGGLAVLSVFVLITALINRSGLYLLFAAWLAINLRMAELSLGVDTQWMGSTLPIDLVPRLRLMTTAIYYAVTVVLFGVLFKEELSANSSIKLLRFIQWSCLPIIISSLVLDYHSYLPFLWIFTGLSILFLVFYLSKILTKTRSRVAIWYSIGLTISLFASFSEVLAAALGLKIFTDTVNSVTAALASSLLTALAIAEHMREEHRQRLDVQAELAHTFHAMPIGMFTLNLEGRLLSANPALLNMLGQSVIDPHARWDQFFEPGVWAQLHRHVHDRRAPRAQTPSGAQEAPWVGGGAKDAGPRAPAEFEIRGALRPGEPSPRRYLVKATLTRGKIQGSLQDVTEKSKASEELYFLANHDSLTKVLNRRGLELGLQTAMHRLPTGTSMSMAYLDLDRFKLINDMFGHAVGDEVLRQVCERVTNMLPDGMFMGRVGGDEFVIAFSQTPIAMAEHMCRGIVDCIKTKPYRSGASAFYVQGSIGLIEVSQGMALKDALSGADRACQHAKLANRAGLMVYHQQSAQFLEHEAHLRLIGQLANSAPSSGLYLEMQPVMSLANPAAGLDFEVLLRMRNPDGTEVPTERLIRAAQASGRMGEIDLWVVSSTLAWLNQHIGRLGRTHFACVNLSGSSLNDEQFLTEVYELLEDNRHIVHLVCLEITESVALQDIDNTRKFVNKARRIGARVALDDFGAGYTSFAYLKEISADMLKIDGSFILNMTKHPANLAIVETIVSLAKNLGMQVIAEWVEDHGTLQTLTEIGVDYAQGFVISKSVMPDQILSVASAFEFLKPEKPLVLVPADLPQIRRSATPEPTAAKGSLSL
jgi:diguanylate cyclase (GGDEF)-like protein